MPATREDTNARTKRVNSLVTKSVKEFSKALVEFSDKIVPDELVLLQRQLVLEILRRVVLKTPVDTGRARGNWQVTVDNPPVKPVDISDTAGADTINKGISKLAELGFGKTVWISNNLDYIVFLEDGSSTQAPKGMLRITLEELRTMFQ